MQTKTKLLFVDDEESIRDLFYQGMLNGSSLHIKTARDGEEALKILKSFPADIVITDVMMPNMDGMDLLEEIRMHYPDIFVLIVTGNGNIKDAVKAIKAGAYDYIRKPFNFSDIKKLVGKINEHKGILQRNIFTEKDRRRQYRFEHIIGRDPKMFKIFQRIVDVTATNATVLIQGETGTGKELVAEAIHYRSPRKNGPVVKVNCGALTETLINSELFGHEKGAFTGALSQKKGHFEVADEGTIFLDEIGDVPAATQISLLRVLELGTFQRVGGSQTIKVNTRFICATNKDLAELVELQLFREDLYYRINVVSIHIPPLRERKSDIPLLVNHYLRKHCAQTEKNILRISRPAMEMLLRYDWPGNVRELTNVVERAVIFCKGNEITPEVLSAEIKSAYKKNAFTMTLSSPSLPEAESTLIRKVLQETNYNLKLAAKEMDIARGTLYSKMKKYGIEKTQ